MTLDSGNFIYTNQMTTASGSIVTDWSPTSGTTTSNGTTMGTITAGSAGTSIPIITKRDLDGNLLWQTKLNINNNALYSTGICSLSFTTTGIPNNDIIGSYYGNAGIVSIFTARGATPANLTTKGDVDSYIISYNSAGNYNWAAQIGGVLVQNSSQLITGNTSLYVSSDFQSSSIAFYNSGGSTHSGYNVAGSTWNVYIASLSSVGTFNWSRLLTTSGTCKLPSVRYYNNFLWLTFLYDSNVSVLNQAGTTLVGPVSGSAVGLAKFNISGSCVQICKLLEGTYLNANNIVDGNSYGIYLNFPFRDNVIVYNFDGTIYTILSSVSSSYWSFGFVHYTLGGTGVRVTTWGGSDQDVYYSGKNDMKVNNSGSIAISCGYGCNPITIYNFGATLPGSTLMMLPSNTNANTPLFMVINNGPSSSLSLPAPSSLKKRTLVARDISYNTAVSTLPNYIQTQGLTYSSLTFTTSGSGCQLYWNGNGWEVLSNTGVSLS